MAVTQEAIRQMAIAHGVMPSEKSGICMLCGLPATDTEDVRLLKEQRDTVARQWMDQNLAVEELSRTCLFCEFVGQSRVSLKTHMRAKHHLG